MKLLFRKTINEFNLDEKGNITVFSIPSQHVYINLDKCSCRGNFQIIKHINKALLGLSEFITVCGKCKKEKKYVFSISNKKYQEWFKKFASGKINIEKELEKLLNNKEFLENYQTKIKENSSKHYSS